MNFIISFNDKRPWNDCVCSHRGKVQRNLGCHPWRAPWLPIRKRIEFKIVLLVRHCMVGSAPEYLMELCRPVSSAIGRQSHRSASRGDLIIPQFWLQTFGYRAFAVSGPQLWNSLPLDVRQFCDNLHYSKKNWKHSCSSSSVDPNLMKGLTSALCCYYYY